MAQFLLIIPSLKLEVLMNAAIFSTTFDSYNIMHIIYAGAVQEIPKEKRKNAMSHFFRILTRQGAAFCYFKGGETARKARILLETMMESAKPNQLFRFGSEIVDVESIISYGRIFRLRDSEDGKSYAFTVILNTMSERNNQLSFSFNSEESAKKARAVLWSIMETFYSNRINQSSGGKKEGNIMLPAIL
jgi:hypothetical protein